eukprot:21508_1
MGGNNISEEQTSSDSIAVKSYHVSCESDRPKQLYSGSNIAGIVLYAKGGKTDWYCNGIHCKAGYIIMRYSNKVDRLETTDGSAIHGKVYKSIFGVSPGNNIFRSGFARVSGDWKYNSWSCNGASNGWTDGKKQMNATEQKAVKQAIQSWISNGEQNTYTDKTLYINPN